MLLLPVSLGEGTLLGLLPLLNFNPGGLHLLRGERDWNGECLLRSPPVDPVRLAGLLLHHCILWHLPVQSRCKVSARSVPHLLTVGSCKAQGFSCPAADRRWVTTGVQDIGI